MPIQDPLKSILERFEMDYPTIDLPAAQAEELRAAIRNVPKFILKDAWLAIEQGSKLPVPLQLGPRLNIMKQAIREVLYERGEKAFLDAHPG